MFWELLVGLGGVGLELFDFWSWSPLEEIDFGSGLTDWTLVFLEEDDSLALDASKTRLWALERFNFKELDDDGHLLSDAVTEEEAKSMSDSSHLSKSHQAILSIN